MSSVSTRQRNAHFADLFVEFRPRLEDEDPTSGARVDIECQGNPGGRSRLEQVLGQAAGILDIQITCGGFVRRINLVLTTHLSFNKIILVPDLDGEIGLVEQLQAQN